MKQSVEQRGKLEKVTQTILANEYFKDIESFLTPHLREKEKKTYTLFITRRCSCLAYIFKRIIEERHPEKAELKNNHLLTNSALINAAPVIAQEVAEGNNPDIFLVDDSISYGRAVTNILDLFVNRFTKALRAIVGDTADALAKEYVKNYIKIHVYMKKNHYDLLSQTYRDITDAEKTVAQSVWNDFSTRVSELINNADVANAAFVYSAGVDEIPKTSSENWRMVNTNYYEHKQTTFFRAVPNEENCKAICSIRCFPCSVNVKYRIVPFIFFPNLREKELKRLEERVFRKLWKNIKPTETEKTLQKDLKYYQENTTLRSRAEFVTMYLSQSLLLAFIKHQCEKILNLHDYDCQKINWTYSYFDKKLPIWNNLFNDEKLNDPGLWLTEEEVNEVVSDAVESMIFAEVKDNGKRIPFYMEESMQDKFVNLEIGHEVSLEEVYERLLFDRAVDSEQKSHDLAEKQFFLLNSQRFTSDPDRRYELGEFERDISKKAGAQYSLVDLLAMTLQMMDAGLMSIVTRDIADDVYGGNGIYHVLEQQVRVCEQALCAYPRRYYEYMETMEKILKEEDCDWTDYETFMIILQYQIGLKLKAELQKMGLSDKQVGELLPQLKKMLLLFKKSFQKIEYWGEGVIRRFAIKAQGDEPTELPIPKGVKLISGML